MEIIIAEKLDANEQHYKFLIKIRKPKILEFTF